MTLLADLPLASGSTQRRLPEPYLPGLEAANEFLPGFRRKMPTRVAIDLVGISPSERPRWVGHAENEFTSLLALDPGWDGHRAKPVSRRALDAATAVMFSVLGLSNHHLLPQIFPLPGGGVQLEWHVGDNDVEIEVSEIGEVGVLAVTSTGEVLHEGEAAGASGAALLEAVSRFVSELSDRVASARGGRR
jgi:hypothetical protein